MANSMLSSMSGWDKPGAPTTTSRVVSPTIKDDWEDDESSGSEDEPPSVEKNQQIWQDANTKPQYTMPSVVVARTTSTPSSSITLPPQAAFQQGPAIKILKRPTSNSPSPAPSNQGANTESLKEREARYQAARDRIFGGGSSGEGDEGSRPASVNAAKPQAKIAREPLGPPGIQSSAASATQSRGFANRRGKPPAGGQS
ncbi:hypothetical protein BKA70DRAFT_1271237 [Coprinopsis sp. MPI-PUGE-AT-0042]|nr:hypothetical protein BKA70DRAFT_1271237 [Coprinopsis sp. MPI-PUGE-AT-0042]